MYSTCEYFYNLLEDNISKEIYRRRVAFSYTKDYEEINKIVEMTDFYHHFRNILRGIGKPIILYGAGRRSKRLISLYPGMFSAVVDSDKNKTGDIWEGLVVLSPHEAFKKYSDAVYIVVPKHYQSEIKDTLNHFGVGDDRIVLFENEFSSLSKKIYFDLPYLKKFSEEVFVDCGAFDGETSCDFIKWSNSKLNKIIMFEPDPYNYKRCRSIFCENSDISVDILQKIAWSSSGLLRFKALGTVASSVCEEESCGNEVESIAIDEVCADEKVTFIKMDIEGAELNALKGAISCIRKNRPNLAISIYHKQEDIINIPMFLLDNCDNYKYYLRHYTISDGDTVLYAIPQ